MTNIDRGVVTAEVEARLTSGGVLVGLVTAPKTGGWQKEMTAEGAQFVPYVVVTPLNAQGGSGSLGDSTSEWQVPYSLSSYGVDVRQVEDLADDARRILLGLRRHNFSMRDGSSWQVTQTRPQAIGGVGYTTQVDPTAFSQTDSVTLWLSRNL